MVLCLDGFHHRQSKVSLPGKGAKNPTKDEPLSPTGKPEKQKKKEDLTKGGNLNGRAHGSILGHGSDAGVRVPWDTRRSHIYTLQPKFGAQPSCEKIISTRVQYRNGAVGSFGFCPLGPFGWLMGFFMSLVLRCYRDLIVLAAGSILC